MSFSTLPSSYAVYIRSFFSSLLAGAASASSTTSTNVTSGPENGHLVIVGGHLESEKIWKRIIELAGGPDAPFVVVPTAAGDPVYDSKTNEPIKTLKRLGATNVTLLHTYNRTEADTDEFITPLKNAGGVFFGGGRQWRLVDAYAGTKTEQAFQSVLDRGGVISGSSAGASIQASFLARGDTKTNQIMAGDHKVGFGYLKNAAIDQHFLARNRHFDMLEITKAYPHLLGFSVDEDTALIVNKTHAEVFGGTYVAVYDGSVWSNEGTELKTLPSPENRFYFLKSGDRYNLAQRKVVDDPARASTG